MIRIYELPPLDRTATSHEAYDPVFTLTRCGQGSGQFEALSSYVSRLAERHWMLTGSFIRYLIKNHTEPESASTFVSCTQQLFSMNGKHLLAQRICDALRHASSADNLELLTFLPWGRIFDANARGMTKAELAWCVDCWQEDHNRGDQLYVRLSWLANPVTICSRHLRALSNRCSRCDSKQPVVPKIPRNWICQGCGHTLFDIKRSRTNPKNPPARDIWVTRSIEKMIERISCEQLSPPADAFATALNGIVEIHAMGSIREFARSTSIEPKTVEKWLTGQTRPRFDTLIDLCYKLDIPLDRFLLDSTELTSPLNWRQLSTPKVGIRHNLSPAEMLALKKRLKEIIRIQPEIPPRPSDIAHEFNMSYTSIQYHFPEEYALIKQRADTYRNESINFQRQRRLKDLQQSVQSLTEKNIYPGERQLRERSLMSPSDLRRKDVKINLKIYQDEFKKIHM